MIITKDELSDLIEKLEGIRGRHTELISVYIPKGYDINSVQKQLEAEKSTAKNIKSTSTRKNVSDALDKIVRHLKEYKQTPLNGLAVFCGNVAEVEGQNDLQLWAIEPPEEINIRLYRCDKEFVLEPLQEMTEVSELYGLVVMDRKEATIGMLNGKKIDVIQKITSGIPSKIRAGGQSSQRFHRITEGLTKEFYKRIAEEMKKAFFENPKLKGILIGGPVPTKDEFLDNDYLTTQLREKVLGRVDLGDTSESGLDELVERSHGILANQELIEEKQLLEKFFENLGKNTGLAIYDKKKLELAFECGAIDILIISKDFDKTKIKELKKKAEEIGAKIKIVSKETVEGEQFVSVTKGIGALLRFKL